MRAGKAEVILVAQSRCGKTPTTMYLALYHGVYAATFPLVDEDFPGEMLPAPLRPYAAKCFDLTSNPLRLSQVWTERRPGSDYASLSQCGIELRSAERPYVTRDIPYLNSASMSVEEISAVILERMRLRHWCLRTSGLGCPSRPARRGHHYHKICLPRMMEASPAIRRRATFSMNLINR